MMDELIAQAREIAAMLAKQGQTVGVSESSSGGLVSAALVAVPGASKYYRGGGVIYAPPAFRGLMGLDKSALVDGMRSSSEPYALMMAGVIRERLRADWGLCETGASGPGGNGYGDAAGHTCVAVVGPDGMAISRTLETGLSDRAENMRLFAREALALLSETLAAG